MTPSDQQKKFWVVLGVLAVFVLMWLANVRHNRSPSGEQLQHFDGVLAEGSGTQDPAQSALYVRAGEALKNGDGAGAETIYREIAAKYPKDPDSFSALGACLY